MGGGGVNTYLPLSPKSLQDIVKAENLESDSIINKNLNNNLTTHYSAHSHAIYDNQKDSKIKESFTNAAISALAQKELESKNENITWKNFKIIELFNYERGTRLTKGHRISGDIPLITAGESNLGVKEFIGNESQKIFSNAITIDMFCNCFVHISPFCCDDNILVLTAKGQMSKYHLMFISAIIGKCKPQYGYGKQYRIGSLEKHYITLPTLDSKINFSFMETFIKAIEKQHIETICKFWETKLYAYNAVINGGGGG